MLTVGDAWRMACQYSETGQLAPAEHMFRYVLEMDPNHAEALSALGRIEFINGNPQAAITCLRKVTELKPGNADWWNDLGAAYAKAEAYADAVAACEQALRLRPENAQACNNLGFALLYQGNFQRAAGVLQDAVRLRPDMADAYGNLGIAFKCLDRPEEAARALEEAVRLNPRNVHAANWAGIVLQRLGDIDRAIAYYQYVLQVNPGYTDASSNLATCYKEQGRFEEAVAQYHAILRHQPDYILAYYNLSELAVAGRYQFDPQELNRLRSYWAADDLPPLWRSVVGIALGSVLDLQGDYGEAFRHFHQAAELRLSWLRENNRLFDARAHCNFVTNIISTFDRAYFDEVNGGCNDTELPIFILGMPRSGTTLLEHILATHPHVFGAGELGEFPRMMVGLTGNGGGSNLARPVPFSHSDVSREVATRYLRRLTRSAGNATRVTDKTLENFVYLGLIATLFPRARVIYCRRDPRDVCLSCYFHNFEYMDYSWSLTDLGNYYRQYERLMAHWCSVLPLTIHEVSYEELIANQEKVTRDMLSYCGLNWDERCLRFHKTKRLVQTASTIQVRKPLSASSIGHWKKYQAHLSPLLEALNIPNQPEHKKSRLTAGSTA